MNQFKHHKSIKYNPSPSWPLLESLTVWISLVMILMDSVFLPSFFLSSTRSASCAMSLSVIMWYFTNFTFELVFGISFPSFTLSSGMYSFYSSVTFSFSSFSCCASLSSLFFLSSSPVSFFSSSASEWFMDPHLSLSIFRSSIPFFSLAFLLTSSSSFCFDLGLKETFPPASSGFFLTAVDLPSRISLTEHVEKYPAWRWRWWREQPWQCNVLDAQVVRLAGVGLGVELDGRVAHLVAHIVVHWVATDCCELLHLHVHLALAAIVICSARCPHLHLDVGFLKFYFQIKWIFRLPAYQLWTGRWSRCEQWQQR